MTKGPKIYQKMWLLVIEGHSRWLLMVQFNRSNTTSY